ncbi:MAG: aldehyde ferredoxin oxidoreductase [Chloroflexi bacterium B3_Chlor]|nr:MAG: aldehyde ferredoxin oxidoreductase [Chloroflexi bacterium B3_Chlor]
MATGGFHGQILRVDLSQGKVSTESLEDDLARDFVGGRGLGSAILWRELPAQTDALSPKNKLIFATGPLNGTGAALSSRYELVTKSPLTNTILSTNSGGRFPIALKRTSFDALIIEGESQNPCYLWVDDQKVELRDASQLWGMNSHETTERLLEETSPKAAVACIGPAGEKGVLLASVMNEKDRAAGRGGAGCVMGAKKLKAVVVQGSHKTPVADPEAFQEARKNALTIVSEAPITKNALKEYGTAVLINIINQFGALPTRNFQEGYFPDADSVSGETLKELLYERSVACATCPVACGRATKTANRSGEGPEFETMWALGPACGVKDLELITEANYNCNESGFDTISAGSTIACAMELWERGYLDTATQDMIREQLGGELRFGNGEAVLKCTELIGRNEGFGKLLAEGSLRLASLFAHPELSMSVKGLELPAYDPRGFNAMGLAYATSNRGGCHLRAYFVGPEALATPYAVDRFASEGKPALVILYQDLSAVIDSLGLCIFTIFALNPEHYASLLSTVTGEPLDGRQLLRMGERIWNLERLFNLREGFAKEDDRLPPRFSQETLPRGHSKNQVVDLEPLLEEYYRLRGWDEEGVPTKEKLNELGLEAV